jgi:hypothetical protein
MIGGAKAAAHAVLDDLMSHDSGPYSFLACPRPERLPETQPVASDLFFRELLPSKSCPPLSRLLLIGAGEPASGKSSTVHSAIQLQGSI